MDLHGAIRTGRLRRSRALLAADAEGARAFLAWLDVELDTLAAVQAVEVERRVEARTVKEVLNPILGGDESEATVRDQLLDSP
jgi:hypothetical protein